ncbi:hypothetical protein Rsub_02311 [Raphidocelis subcapitata]|uniref:U-box domain-containing protein n=1 Tax=Raphidocelis subcapitata TaxID=307507 RepID=A0A2V0NVL3_9CHLO|nr:hypothetical protein Rsub_02311 [Raphidocelis subcapitata]|eukprot:GBF89593.1 hypothetical protein Rsub_02311 [Raphidocelis subcapitata]
MAATVPTGDSMKPYMRMQNLFVREIDPSLPRETVIKELSALCPASKGGKVVVPVSDATGGVWRNQVFGAFGRRFQLTVRNLDPEVDERALFARFSRYGEIYQSRIEADSVGLVHYFDVSSVFKAAAAEHGALWGSTRISVETALPRSSSSGDGSSAGAGPGGSISSSSGGSFEGQVQVAAGAANGGYATVARIAPPSSAPGAAAAAAAAAAARERASVPLAGGQLSLPGYPAPPPQYQQQQQQLALVQAPRGAASGAVGALPAHLSLMLDRQTEAFGSMQVRDVTAAPPAASQPPPLQPYPRGPSNGAAGASRKSPAVPSLAKQLLGRIDNLSELLCCPITAEPFTDPVLASDGQTYERAAIESWLQKSSTSPLTNQPLAGALMPNTLVKALVEEMGALLG